MKKLVFLLATLLSVQALSAETLPPVPKTDPNPAGALVRGAKRPVAETPMPGVGVMPGDRAQTKSNVLRVGADRTEIAYISSQFPNRIATPFANPRAIDTNEAEVKPEGQSLYVIAKDPSKAVALFITGDKPTDPVVSLTLVPKALPPQTIVLQLDGVNTEAAVKEEMPAPAAYLERVRYVMRQIALGKTPAGFVEGALPQASAAIGELVVYLQSRYSGSSFDLYRYKVANSVDRSVELDESAFYSDGVRAVAFFPTSVLSNKGDTTFVYVIADKTATGN